MELTSRERVECALNHQEADRVPLDLGSTPFTTIHKEVAKELNRLLGIKQDKFDFVSFSAQVVKLNDELMNHLQIDTVGVTTKLPSSYKMVLVDDSYTDEWNIVYKKVPGSYQYDFLKHPLAKSNKAEMENFPFPDPLDDSRFEGFRSNVKEFYDKSDKAIVLNTPYGCQVMAVSAWLCGFERHFMDIAIDHDYVHTLNRRLTDWYIQWLDRALAEVGEYISVVTVADDLGIQNGPMIKPESYRELFQPYHQEIYSFIKKNTDAKIFLHSCGSVVEFMDDIIANGADILNPVQVAAKDMDTKYLKEKWGDKLTFWGGACNSQKTLPFGTQEEVLNEVRERIDDLKPGGGFVFAPIHNILPGVSGEKVNAMYKLAAEYGIY